MGRKKGDGRGRLGGRQKGTTNKDRCDIHKTIKKFVNGSYDEFFDSWERLDPYQKCRVYLGLLAYVLPKPPVEVIRERLTKKTFEDELNELEETIHR